MVVDANHQSSNTMSSTSAKKSEVRSKKKSSTQMNGFNVFPQPGPSRSLSRSLSSGPVAQRRLSGCGVYMGTCSWMRRSESSCTLNSSSSSSRGRLRSAGSLPSISKAAAADNKTIKRSSCLLVALRPTNVEEEREKFFISDYCYNPQFQYQEPMSLSVLEKYSQASNQFLEQALRILNTVLNKYGSYETFESSTGGNLLSKCQIWSCCRRYMQKESCSGECMQSQNPCISLLFIFWVSLSSFSAWLALFPFLGFLYFFLWWCLGGGPAYRRLAVSGSHD
ncbi:hypothetical protein GDO81_015623 [Engystomops pustulosus]|uniref:Uncharacterized protein n=1 Tax=Engystomops pustulosus TaxID=76066 RepID=A0AAV7AL18_ENGPU|nr:hypothetical protein GDO81_015623 [Engystomops pustulosus]